MWHRGTVAHKDPEKRREYARRYREEHREEARERERRWRANPENRARANESKRKSREDPEVRRRRGEREREKRVAGGDELRERERLRHLRYRSENREKVRAARARYRQANLEAMRASTRRSGPKVRHGSDYVEVFAATWQVQGGRCYLCGDDLVAEQAFIDHDHRCCPPARSCAYCRRGLACPNCNSMIGFAQDDPARLRQMADNLEAALKDVDARLAMKPEQDTLLLALGHARPETTAGYTLTDNPEAAAAAEGLPVPARLRKVAG